MQNVDSNTGNRSVLVTGASGRIGTAFYQEMLGNYQFRLADLEAPQTHRVEDESLAIDIAEYGQCLAACDGIDTVIHLAANPSPEADFTSLLRNNIQGTNNVFEAAVATGCRRVIFASSIHAIFGYPHGTPILTNWPVWPINLYGVSKCFGEASAAAYSAKDGMSAIAIRIGAYHAPWIAETPTEEALSMYVSARDLNQLLQLSIEAQDVPFAIVHGQSNNRIKRMSLESTVALLGYTPVDDGFALFSPN